MGDKTPKNHKVNLYDCPKCGHKFEVHEADADLKILVALGSIAVHVEEMLSDSGHPVDRQAIESILMQPDVREWLDFMDSQALLPKKRS